MRIEEGNIVKTGDFWRSEEGGLGETEGDLYFKTKNEWTNDFVSCVLFFKSKKQKFMLDLIMLNK